MLRVDVRSLRQGPVSTDGQVPPDHPMFRELDLDLQGPVEVTGLLQASGRGGYYWKGTVSGRVGGECRRCLAPVVTAFHSPVQAVFSADPGAADDPGVYPLTEPVTAVDLSDAIREEVGLSAPAFPLCRDQCAGLCPRCGADRNQGPCGCGPPTT